MLDEFNIEQIARMCGKASKSGKGWNCRCPVPSHGRGNRDRNPSLSITESRGKFLAHCHSGCVFEEIVDALKNVGLLSNFPSSASSTSPYNRQHSKFTYDHKKIEDKNLQALSIWNDTIEAKDTLVERYFHGRGLTITPPENIRFHPNLKYSDQTSLSLWQESYHPAMVSKIQIYPDNKCSGIHRTYLKSDGLGKAQVLNPKKMFGTCAGGAVRFDGESLECVAVGEGIESCLAYLQFNPLLTVWACLSSSGLQGLLLPPPEITREVIILVDHDLPGMSASTKLAERLIEDGRKVFLIMPAEDSWDMNDLLLGEMS